MSKPGDSAASLLESPVRRAIIEALTFAATSATISPLGTSGRVQHTAADLARLLDLHVTTVRFHLDQLDAAGLIESEFVRTGNAGRPRKVYRPALSLLPAITSPTSGESSSAPDHESMRILTGLLTESFGVTDGATPISPEAAGRRWAANHVPATDAAPAATWGQWLGKMGQVIDVLQEWGYTPQLTATTGRTGTRIDLTQCPFRELARANPRVVCGIHKGLIAGTMTQVGEPDSKVDLRAFADGETCIAHIQPSADSPVSATPNKTRIPLRPTDAHVV